MAWTIGNKYLTEAQMQGNAIEVHKYFAKMGWSLNAIGSGLRRQITPTGQLQTDTALQIRTDSSIGYKI